MYGETIWRLSILVLGCRGLSVKFELRLTLPAQKFFVVSVEFPKKGSKKNKLMSEKITNF